MLALWLEDILRDEGADVLGPVADLSAAFDLLDRTKPDGVTLDLNLRGESGIPIADLLLERGIPYVIASAYSPSDLPSRHAHVHYLTKPFYGEALVNALLKSLSSSYKASAPPPHLCSTPSEFLQTLM
jgi:DNA-binding response OmpR family regulator